MEKLLLVGQNNTGEESKANGLDAGTLAQSMDRETMQNSALEAVAIFGRETVRLELEELRRWIESTSPDHVVLVETDLTHLVGLPLLQQLAREQTHRTPPRSITVDVAPIHKPTVERARIELWGRLLGIINK